MTRRSMQSLVNEWAEGLDIPDNVPLPDFRLRKLEKDRTASITEIDEEDIIL